MVAMWNILGGDEMLPSISIRWGRLGAVGEGGAVHTSELDRFEIDLSQKRYVNAGMQIEIGLRIWDRLI